MSIVNPVKVRMVCEVFPCKSKAMYMIGQPNRKQGNFYVCEEHLKEIVEGGSAFLKESSTKQSIPEVKVAETVITKVEEKQESEVVVPFSDEIAPTELPRPSTDTYTCKHCGEQFPKNSDGKIDLMKHSKVCPNKPKS